MKSDGETQPEALGEALRLSRVVGLSMSAGVLVVLFVVVAVQWMVGESLLSVLGMANLTLWVHLGLAALVVAGTAFSLSVEPSLLKKLRRDPYPSSRDEVNRNHYSVLKQRTVTQLTIAEILGLVGVVGYLFTGSSLDLLISLVPAGYLCYRHFPTRTGWIELIRSEGVEPSMLWDNPRTESTG